MKGFAELVFMVVGGLLLGGVLSWASVRTDEGFGATRVGSWTAWPSSGRPDSDPYTKARVAAGGEIPLGAAEGLAFLARRDADDRKLRLECRYEIAGETPPARLWTLSYQRVEDSTTRAIATDSPLLTSSDVLRDEKGDIRVVVGPGLAGPNWLKTQGGGRYQLAMRFYDTPLTGTGALDGVSMPRITMLGC